MDFKDITRSGTAPESSKNKNYSNNFMNNNDHNNINSYSNRPKTRSVDNDMHDFNIDLRANKVSSNYMQHTNNSYNYVKPNINNTSTNNTSSTTTTTNNNNNINDNIIDNNSISTKKNRKLSDEVEYLKAIESFEAAIEDWTVRKDQGSPISHHPSTIINTTTSTSTSTTNGTTTTTANANTTTIYATRPSNPQQPNNNYNNSRPIKNSALSAYTQNIPTIILQTSKRATAGSGSNNNNSSSSNNNTITTTTNNTGSNNDNNPLTKSPYKGNNNNNNLNHNNNNNNSSTLHSTHINVDNIRVAYGTEVYERAIAPTNATKPRTTLNAAAAVVVSSRQGSSCI